MIITVVIMISSSSYIHTYIHTYIPAYIPTYKPTYKHTLPTYLPTYIQDKNAMTCSKSTCINAPLLVYLVASIMVCKLVLAISVSLPVTVTSITVR